MSLLDLIRDKEKAIVKAESETTRIWRTLQNDYWLSIDKLIAGLRVNKEKKLLFTFANLRRLAKIATVINKVWTLSRKLVFSGILGRLRGLWDKNKDFIKESTKEPVKAPKTVFDTLLAYYGYSDGKVIPGTLFDALAPGSDFTGKVVREIQQAITLGVNIDKFRDKFRAAFNNPQSGFAMTYYSRFTRDMYFQFDRATAFALAKENGLNHAIYAGTLKDNTREFCEDRLNRVYTSEEIAKWNNKEWKGKHRLVPVEFACGGYNCRHTLNYISKELAEVFAARRGGINTYGNIVLA